MGYLVLETGEYFEGVWQGGTPQAGEVVFNTSHSGYEEMATDPSYFSQIMVMTAPQQGNYGVSDEVWESKNIWIRGFVCLEIQSSDSDQSWKNKLTQNKVPVMTGVDTRSLVLTLRNQGTVWGALVNSKSSTEAKEAARSLIEKAKQQPKDWTQLVCRKAPETLLGAKSNGPRIAVLDFGAKENIIRELVGRAKEIKIFPSATSAAEIMSWNPDGIMLTNGPGDPSDVHSGIETVRGLLGKKFIFGICMGHQVLALALGGKTYKLKYGHRGSNHPIQDQLLNKVYVTSQNHGYNVDQKSLPPTTKMTHINLNDHTVAGIYDQGLKCMSVQFHPESHPGPHDAVELFDFFVKQIREQNKSN